jgi:diguanylate cyclase (GGDEF)-like protein
VQGVLHVKRAIATSTAVLALGLRACRALLLLCPVYAAAQEPLRRPPELALVPPAIAAPFADAAGFALRAAGQAEAASRAWEACAALADRTGLRLHCLGNAGIAAAFAGQRDLAARLQRARRDLAQGRDPHEEIDARLALAQLERRAGDLAVAETGYRETIALARRYGEKLGEAQAWSGLSLVRKNVGDYYEALEAETAALTLRSALGPDAKLHYSYINLAALYEQLEDLERARDYQSRALAASTASSDPLDRASAQVSMAGLLNDSGAVYAATAYALAQDAYERHRRLGNRPGMLDAQFHRGRALFALGRLDEAQRELEPLVAEAARLGQRASRAHVEFRLAEIAAARGNSSEAIALAQRALAAYVAVDNPHRQAKVHALLQALYAAAGDDVTALRHEVLRLRLREQLLGVNVTRRVGALFDEFRAQRDADRIGLLERDHDIVVARRERDRYQRGVWVLIAASLGIALALVAWRWRRSLASYRFLAARARDTESERRRLAEANAKLYASATTDGLTGIANRSRGLERLRQALAIARDDGYVAIGLVDVDHFKVINDTWGHQAGDAVLCGVADALERTLADAVVVARVGGEEFLVVLDGDAARNPAPRFEAARLAMAEIAPETDIRVTVSIGWCVHRGPGAPVDLLFAAADAAMYRAKAMGRDRVEGSIEAVSL